MAKGQIRVCATGAGTVTRASGEPMVGQQCSRTSNKVSLIPVRHLKQARVKLVILVKLVLNIASECVTATVSEGVMANFGSDLASGEHFDNVTPKSPADVMKR